MFKYNIKNLNWYRSIFTSYLGTNKFILAHNMYRWANYNMNFMFFGAYVIQPRIYYAFQCTYFDRSYIGLFYYGHEQMDSNISSRYLDNGQQSKFKLKHTTQQHHRSRPHGGRYLYDKPWWSRHGLWLWLHPSILYL